jgi:hypothetical protein
MKDLSYRREVCQVTLSYDKLNVHVEGAIVCERRNPSNPSNGSQTRHLDGIYLMLSIIHDDFDRSGE